MTIPATTSPIKRSGSGDLKIITAMPAAMQRLETETAHLPKPKKKDEGKEDVEKAE